MEFEGVIQAGVLSVAGRIDSQTAADCERAVENLLAQDGFTIDMSGVTFISSAGLRVLMMAARQLAKSDRKLVLVRVPQDIRHILQMSGFGAIMTIEADV
jgi:anti-sigma B factor antagonist